MKSKEKFIRVITEDEGEEILAIDAIESISRRDSGAKIVMKSGVEYKIKVLNMVLDAIEPFILSSESTDTEVEHRKWMLNEYGIISESQPQFLNILEGRSSKLINVGAIKKFESNGDITLITIFGEKEAIEVACPIRDIMDALPNIVPIDGGE